MKLSSSNPRRSDATHGLTLVELLVTIMIIGILSSSVLFAMSVAQEAARKSRTQAIIATLHSLLIEKWESYLTRRQNVQINDEYNSTGPRAAALIRLKIVRQMLAMDFPDQWPDVENATLNNDAANSTYQTYIYASHNFARLNAINYIATLPGLSATDRTALLNSNEGAECLFSIIQFTRATADRYNLIDSSYIGDTDGDSLPEILDGWGRPITFIRWPSGFISDLQAGKPGTADLSAADGDSGWLDHDPFDPLRADPRAYRTVPLIISAGPDGMFDIRFLELTYSNPPNTTDMNNRWNPYYAKPDSSGIPRRAGETGYDENKDGIEQWHDNIHNHLINTR